MALRRMPVTLALITVLLGSACGGGGASESSTPKRDASATSPAAVALLPEEIKSAGVLRIGASYQTAPMTMLTDDGQTKKGISHELARLAAERLGLKADFQVIPFPGQVAALEADKIDLVWETTSITPDRLKAASFVEFADLAYGVLVPKGNPKKIGDLASFCGLRIGVPQGSIFQEYVETASKDCEAAGGPKVEVLTYKGPPEARLAVRSGNADAFLGGHANNLYYAKQSENGATFSAVEVPDIATTPIGIQFQKDNTDLAKAVAEAVNSMIADGSYGKVFEQFELAGMQIEAAKLAE